MWGELFRQIYRAPLILLKAMLANPLSLFVYGIMSKWYILVMIPTVIITFWVFKGLEKSGVLQAAQVVISKALTDCKSVAQNCTPLIMDLPATWECVKNPPEYAQTADEVKLENDVNEAMKLAPQVSDSEPSSRAGGAGSDAAQSTTNPYDH